MNINKLRVYNMTLINTSRFSLFSLYFTFMVMVAYPAFAATAVGTETVLNKVFGVNLHMDNCCHGQYADVDEVIKQIKYIGARRVRDWATTDAVIGKWRAINAATGVTFHVSIPQTSPKKQLLALNRIQQWLKMYPGLIDVIEGSNEPDTAYPKSQGASLADSAAMQPQVYAVGKNARVRVAQLSVGGGWEPPFYEGNYKKFGRPPADLGNAHVYMNPTAPPSSALQRIGKLAAHSVNGKPVDVTEFGVYQSKKQDDATNSAFMHMAPFSSYLLGHAGLFVYALHDDISGVVSFYKADGTKRAFADYWHHTTQLLSDPRGKNLPPKNINISYVAQKAAGKPPLGIKNILMYKSDGSIWIAMYDEERLNAPNGSQTIKFDKSYPYVKVFDARNGIMINNFRNIKTLNIKLPINHVYLVSLSSRP